MITLDDLKKYKMILDDENVSKEGEKFLDSAIGREIGEMRQNLTIVMRNLGSKEFIEMTKRQLRTLCEDDEVINELKNIINYFG